ncbi:hypothetical protein [Salininema proteolyticum]|uniref:Uncharacterized protein n=1 Tax=Salininema proteolyticum TaxID=1607685 RepID=A0ABV8TUT9_9ACTN
MAGKKRNSRIEHLGHLLVLISLALWLRQDLILITSLSGAGTSLLLFWAPSTCSAPTQKKEPCRNNSKGLLGGCHITQHRWARYSGLFGTEPVSDAFTGWFSNAQRKSATAVMAIGFLNLVASGGALTFTSLP